MTASDQDPAGVEDAEKQAEGELQDLGERAEKLDQHIEESREHAADAKPDPLGSGDSRDADD